MSRTADAVNAWDSPLDPTEISRLRRMLRERASIQVAGPIPLGSIILLRNVRQADDDYTTDWPTFMDDVGAAIESACGHRRFALMAVEDGTAEVEIWSPDDDMEAKVKALIEKAQR